MDMNWIDEIRDPEPRKRYIYNADDYDPQYGDPYYREHSTRDDSLWRLYEESGTSITFDAFADESRQTDYRMETGALRDFFNGSQSALSSYRNPMGGNPLIAFGVIGRWDGERTGISSFETFDDLMNGDDSPFKDCEIDHIWDENGILKMRGHHHDGSVEVEIRQLTDQGCEALNPTNRHGLANRSTPQADATTAARNPWTASGTTWKPIGACPWNPGTWNSRSDARPSNGTSMPG